MIIWCDDPTEESIASALAARDAERRQIEQATGLRIQESGRIERPAVNRPRAAAKEEKVSA